MSRATALAYETEVKPQRNARPEEYSWPGRGDTAAYNLLGGGHELFGGPVPLRLDDEQLEPLEAQAGYLDQAVEMPSAYFASDIAAQRSPRLPVLSLRLFFGIAVAVLLAVALMLVTPVLARGLSSNTITLSVSRYSDMAASAAAQAGDPPSIDVTNGQTDNQPQPAVASAPPLAAPGQYTLVSAPSISVQQIENVLAQYGSPAAGQGQALYDLGVRYGIDPAYGLAFFVHESGCGTRGVARFTHSLGNIRWTDGFDNYEGYRSYPSWQAGMEDWYKLITDLYINGWGLRTVDQIIPVYAPAADNNSPPTYIASIKSMVDSWRGK